jgi:hypothetical protein
MATSKAKDDSKNKSDAKDYGQHLAAMLAVSRFSPEAKQAWAALVPSMTPDQLAKFDAMLQADMKAQAAGQLEGAAVQIKAAQHKRDFALSALDTQTNQALDDIEAQLKSAE